MNDQEIVLATQALHDQYDHVVQTAMRDRVPGETPKKAIIKVLIDRHDGRVITIGPFYSKEVALNVTGRFYEIAKMVRFTVEVPK